MSYKFLPYPITQCKKYYIMGEKRIFSARVDQDPIKELTHLAADTGTSLGTLLEEAIQDLLNKYIKEAKEL
jgi:predicted HicB family RNase H-like nuclease